MNRMESISQLKVKKRTLINLFFFLLFIVSCRCENQIKTDQNAQNDHLKNVSPALLRSDEMHVKDGISTNEQLTNGQLFIHLDPLEKTVSHSQKQVLNGNYNQLIKDEIDDSEVLKLSKADFNKILHENNHLLVYFYTQQCQFCDQFDKTYEKMKKTTNQKQTTPKKQIIYAKVGLNEQTQSIFKQYDIESVPQIKYFYKGQLSNYSYIFNQYDESSILRNLRWIQRLSRISQFQEKALQYKQHRIYSKTKVTPEDFYILEVENVQALYQQVGDSMQKILVFNCSYVQRSEENKQLTSFMKNAYLSHLNFGFYCTKNRSILDPEDSQFISQNQVIIQVYVKADQNKKFDLLDTIQLDREIEYRPKSEHNQPFNLSYIYWQNFNKLVNGQVQQWDQDSAIEIFTKNNPAFLLITNNESRSRTVYSSYKKIKQMHVFNSQMPAIKFYYSDLSVRPQQTTRIKKYLTGIQTSVVKSYPYPLLAYLKESDGYVKKYLFPLQIEINEQNMETWILNVIKQLEVYEQEQAQIGVSDSNGDEIVLNQGFEMVQMAQEGEQGHEQFSRDKQQLHPKQYFKCVPQMLFPPPFLQRFSSIYLNQSLSLQKKLQSLHISKKYFQPQHNIQLISFLDFRILLSSLYKKQFFVFISWKNDIESYELFSELSSWWQHNQEEEQESGKDNPASSGDASLTNQKAQQDKIEQNKQTDKVKNQQHKLKDQVNNAPQENPQQDISHKLPNVQQQSEKDSQNVQTPINSQSQGVTDETKNQQEDQRILTQIFGKNQVPKGENPVKAIYSEQKQQRTELQVQEDDYKRYKQLSQIASIYVLYLNINDYPRSFTDQQGTTHQIRINYVPSLLYFSEDKCKTEMIEGPQSFKNIHQFIVKSLTTSKNDQSSRISNKHQQTQKPQSKVQSQTSTKSQNYMDRELEGINYSQNEKIMRGQNNFHKQKDIEAQV